MRREIIRNPSLIYWALQMILQELELSWEDRVFVHQEFLNILQREVLEEKAAREVWDIVCPHQAVLKEKLQKRALLIYSQVEYYLRKGKILDFGCGDGRVGQLVADNTAQQVCLYDVADYRRSSVRDANLPFFSDWQEVGAQQFDTVMSLLVFHHSEDPDQEVSRLSKVCQRLVVIESVIDDSIVPWSAQATIDWIYNRGFHPGAMVPVPGQFRTSQDWLETFCRHGFSLVDSQDLGIDLPIVPEHHWLFVLDREV